MHYIERFIKKGTTVENQYGELKYEVNQYEKSILVNSATKDVLKKHLIFGAADISRLDTDCYVVFYDDENEDEIFEILDYEKK